jgi:multiple sugar transport system permease protein
MAVTSVAELTTVDPQTPAAPAARAVRSIRPRRSRGRVPGRSWVLTATMFLVLAYVLLPLVWLVISSTKTQAGLFSSFGLWFTQPFALWDNIVGVFTYDGGIFAHWLGNTLLYVIIGAGGSTLLATLAGYGLAKFEFTGKRAVMAVVLGAIAIPSTALTVPIFLLFSQVGLTNTPWAVIIPSLVTPFGMFLMWTYSREAVPTELLEAARMDGAGELRTFFTISLRLLGPGVISVLLLEVVGSWNNYFLPLIMLNDPTWYPLTVGLNQWNDQATTQGGDVIYNLVITGSLIMIIPLVVSFLFLQRFWQSGLAAGAVKA